MVKLYGLKRYPGNSLEVKIIIFIPKMEKLSSLRKTSIVVQKYFVKTIIKYNLLKPAQCIIIILWTHVIVLFIFIISSAGTKLIQKQ